MRFELFIASRYLRAKRRQAFIGIITGISIAGVAAGVAFARGRPGHQQRLSPGSPAAPARLNFAHQPAAHRRMIVHHRGTEARRTPGKGGLVRRLSRRAVPWVRSRRRRRALRRVFPWGLASGGDFSSCVPLCIGVSVVNYCTGLLKTPMDSISTSTVSPGDILRVLPGVPV